MKQPVFCLARGSQWMFRNNMALLRCKLEVRQMRGGHGTQNLKQIGSELWHMSQAVKPYILGLSSTFYSLICLGHAEAFLAHLL